MSVFVYAQGVNTVNVGGGGQKTAKLRNIQMAPQAKMTDENDEETEEICEQGRTYVTGICEGKPSFDDGKYHNHCHECPGFGMCIHDYR